MPTPTTHVHATTDTGPGPLPRRRPPALRATAQRSPARRLWRTAVLLTLAVIMALGHSPAGAQPAPADHGTGTDAECRTYGCLYGHLRCTEQLAVGAPGAQGVRTMCSVAYGVADTRLPDGPDRRFYLGVRWPEGYEPARRAAWDRVAHCESTLRWHLDGRHDGGLQFSPSTWRAYGGTQFAPAAHLALPEQQISVAERVLRLGHGPHGPQGAGAWPHCGRYL